MFPASDDVLPRRVEHERGADRLADGDGSADRLAGDDRTARRSTRRRLLGLAGSLAAATALSGCLVYRVEKDTTTVRRTFDAADVDELRVPVATDAVTLETAGDDADAVEVRADKRARGSTSLSDLELRTETAEGVLRVSTTVPPVTGIGGGSVDLRIGVPSTVSVEQVTAEDGPVTLSGVRGNPTIEAGDGDVVARDVTGDLSVTAEDGPVTVERTGGDATIEASDGDVVAREVGGDLAVSAADGSVTVEGTGGVVTTEAGDGDLSVVGPGAIGDLSAGDGSVRTDVPAVDGTTTVRTDDGDAVVRLAADLDVRVLAATDDGRVSGTDVLDATTQATETNVVGRLGEASNELRVEAGDGDVRLERLG